MLIFGEMQVGNSAMHFSLEKMSGIQTASFPHYALPNVTLKIEAPLMMPTCGTPILFFLLLCRLTYASALTP